MADSTAKAWQEIAKEAQEYRDASLQSVEPAIPKVPADLPLNVTDVPEELISLREAWLTQKPPEELVKWLASGKYTAISVITAFLRRAGLAQALTNCVTELLPTEAIERAKFLDGYLKENGKPIGPLHGLPISVKEHIGMEGLGLNAGFIGWRNRKGKRSAHTLQILWDAGCIFYARTTQPQTLMQLETSSNFYGMTVNPFNRNLTCGGSSGGEGALLGMRGSCLGIGSDVGGSIRSPAVNCGVYGFRPSSHRIPVEGWMGTMGGQEQVVAVMGPMSTSLEGIKLFMKTVIDARPWITEPSLVPIPWNEVPFFGPAATFLNLKKKLKIGVMWHDGVVQPHPPVTRALREVVGKLKEMRPLEIIDWTPYRHDEAWRIVSSLYFPDGGAEIKAAVNESSEPWRPLSTWILDQVPNLHSLSIHELWQLTKARETYRKKYAELWNDTATDKNSKGPSLHMMDVILCPAGPGAAPKLDGAKYWAYTSQWNLLDYPALVFPVTRVNPAVDRWEAGYEPLGEKDKENFDAYKNAEEYAGAPVGLQLVGRRYEDERVIEAAEVIAKVLGLPFTEYYGRKSPAPRPHTFGGKDRVGFIPFIPYI